MSQEQFSKNKFDQNKYVKKYKMRTEAAYHWVYGRRQGILITAKPNTEDGPKECLILSEKDGTLKLLGGSQIQRNCKWAKIAPKFLSSPEGHVLRFSTMIDVTGGNSNFSADYIDLHFDRSTHDFCIYGDRPENLLKCERY